MCFTLHDSQVHPIVMSLFRKGGDIHRKSLGRAVLLLGLLASAGLWTGWIPAVSEPIWSLDRSLKDRLSMIVEPPREREDLVFLGIDPECRAQEGVAPSVRQQSRALQMMREDVDNLHLDRRIYADLINRLGDAGVGVMIFDILFVGPSGNPEADREFADAINRHREKIVLATLLQPHSDGSYEPISSLRQLPGVVQDEQGPHEGYVNLWPDGEDGVVRRMVYTTSPLELQTGAHWPGDRVFESLAVATAHRLGAEVREGRSPRLRYAISAGEPATYAAAYGAHSLHGVFVPDRWKGAYQGGEFFRDKVVLISTATREDGDYHPIPGAVIYGGQFHLQALGSMLDNQYWKPAPQWLDTVAVLVMAGLAVLIGMAFRNPLTILLSALALGGGFVMACAVFSNLTGVLFAGTSGLLGLGLVTIAAEFGQLIARTGVTKAAEVPAATQSAAAP